jgi:hypothetical protein
MRTTADKILAEIARHEEDWCFSPKDFMGLAERDALDQAFSRLTSGGVIRRIGRGVYDVPRYNAVLKKILSPNPNQIARAVARRFGWRILPTGAHAANMLNLSTQVPMKIVYQSDGPTKVMNFESWTLHFKHTAPKKMAAGELGGLLINALQFLGKDHVTPVVIGKLRRRFTDEQKEQLLEDAKYGPDWIHQVIRSLCLGSEDS